MAHSKQTNTSTGARTIALRLLPAIPMLVVGFFLVRWVSTSASVPEVAPPRVPVASVHEEASDAGASSLDQALFMGAIRQLRMEIWSRSSSREATLGEKRNYERLVTLSGRRRQPTVTNLPLADPNVLSRIHVAQEHIARSPAPAFSWEWQKTQAVIAKFGREIPMVVGVGGLDMTVMGYDAETNRLYVFPSSLTEATSSMEALLVHEATHTVNNDLLMMKTGMTAHELTSIGILCNDVSANHRFVDEALAFMNGAAWVEAHPAEMPDTRATSAGWYTDRTLMQDLMRGLRGEASSRVHAMHNLLAYVVDPIRQERARWATAGIPQIPRCGPVVAKSGPFLGHLVLPMNLAPERLHPFFAVLDEASVLPPQL